MALGLRCFQHVRSCSPTRDWTHVCCTEKWILNRWPTREAPVFSSEIRIKGRKHNYWVSVRSVCSFSERGNSRVVTIGTSQFRNSKSSPKPGQQLSRAWPVSGHIVESGLPKLWLFLWSSYSLWGRHFCGCSLCILLSLPYPWLHQQNVEQEWVALILTTTWGWGAAGEGEWEGNSREIMDSALHGARQQAWVIRKLKTQQSTRQC